MCGRFTLRSPASVIAEQFGLLELPLFEARYNIAPSQPVAAVRVRTDEGSRGQRELAWLRWGLVPSWADDPVVGNRMINARSEGVADKPAFRAAFRRRRCLIPADGFYEWQRTGGKKQPYYFHLPDGRPFAFAGLWESWEGPGHEALETCTLLTTDANDVVRPVHDRMPVIIAPADYSAWLDPAQNSPASLTPLLQAQPNAELQAYPVTTRVNSPTREGPGCVERQEAEGRLF